MTLGPRAGFFAGWALFGAYTAIGCGSTIEIGLFGTQFLGDTGIAHVSEYVWLALAGLAIVFALAFNEIRIITRTLLASELLGVILVTILSLVTLATLIFSHGPQGQTFNVHFLQLPAGAGIGTIASAAVYGFLAFAGFEGAAALGEETSEPKRDIPRAIRVAVIVVGVFYLLTAMAQSLGYGTSAAEVKAYQNGFPFGDLGKAYIGSVYADVLILMATGQPARDLAEHRERRRAHPLRAQPRRGRRAAGVWPSSHATASPPARSSSCSASSRRA